MFYDVYSTLCRRKGVSRSQAAKDMGLSNSIVTKWKKTGATPSGDTLSKASAYFDVSLDVLLGKEKIPVLVNGETDAQQKAEIPPGFEPLPKMKKVPLIGDIACGEPITAEQNIVDYVDVPEEVHCDFALRCHGDSMIEAGIRDSDLVYIRTQPEVEDGEIAAVRIGDEATLKRVYYDGESLTLQPCNSAYRARTYRDQELENIRIEGKAVGYFHWF